jgi:DNA-binding PadR family transcriptional regulator
VRSAVLALLAEQPMHGYQIIQEIEQRSHGAWKPSPGSVYPTLQQLEDEGLVRAEDQDGRRVYRLTEDGQRVTAEKAQEFAGMWDAFAPREDDTQLGDLVIQVGAAFVHVMRTGNPEQIAEARKVLARTRSDLYRILGGPESGPGQDSAADEAGPTDQDRS